MPRLIVLGILITLLGTPGGARAANVGEPAPAFSLVDTSGQSHRLSDYQGQIVVLFFVGYG